TVEAGGHPRLVGVVFVEGALAIGVVDGPPEKPRWRHHVAESFRAGRRFVVVDRIRVADRSSEQSTCGAIDLAGPGVGGLSDAGPHLIADKGCGSHAASVILPS